jgi:hypothetical protein
MPKLFFFLWANDRAELVDSYLFVVRWFLLGDASNLLNFPLFAP